MWQNKRLISELGRESETNGTNLGGCQRCLQREMPWAAAALELQMCTFALPVAVQRKICKMRWKRPHHRIEWVSDAGQRTESAALGCWLCQPSFRRGRDFQQVLLVQPSASWLCQCQGGLSREFYQGLISWSLFLQPITKNLVFNILNWIWTHWDVCVLVLVNKLYWIDETGSLCDGLGLPCISKLYLLRMGRCNRVGLLTKRMEGLWKGCVEGFRAGVCEGVGIWSEWWIRVAAGVCKRVVIEEKEGCNCMQGSLYLAPSSSSTTPGTRGVSYTQLHDTMGDS